MRIKTKFRLNLLLVLAMVMLIGMVQSYTNIRIKMLLEKRHLIHDIAKNAVSLNVITFDYLLDHSERAQKQWYISHQSLNRVLERFKTNNKYEQMLLIKIKRNNNNLKIIFPMLMVLPQDHTVDSKDVKQHRELYNRLISQVMVKIQDIVFTSEQLDEMSEKESFNIQRSNTLIVFGMLFFICLLIVLNSTLTGRSILKPIHQFRLGTQIIGKGDLKHKINIHSKDEIGELSNAFDEMTQQLNKTKVSRDNLENEIFERKATEEKNKELAAQLLQMQKLETIGTLAGGIAHDFNNILYPIIGFTELSMMETPENHPIKDNLENILKGALRARDLVKQILAFSSQKDTEQKPILLKPVIQEALKLIRSTISSNIEIIQDLYDDSDYVLANPTEIHEIVMNLCTNAYHAMEERGGTIEISLNRSESIPDLKLSNEEYCCLKISDTGSGISPQIMSNIFDPYFTTKELGKGSGLGLSIIHGIIKKCSGGIFVKSEPEKGAIFSVYLPITSEINVIDEKIKQLPNPIGKESILFVDDEEAIVKLCLRLLESHSYQVTGKTSSIEALALFKDAPDSFDLVITDMAMPKMVGIEFAKELIEIRPDIPIIICTGFSDKLNANIARKIGIKDYIKKPILTTELTLKVRTVLDLAQKQSHSHRSD